MKNNSHNVNEGLNNHRAIWQIERDLEMWKSHNAKSPLELSNKHLKIAGLDYELAQAKAAQKPAQVVNYKYSDLEKKAITAFNSDKRYTITE